MQELLLFLMGFLLTAILLIANLIFWSLVLFIAFVVVWSTWAYIKYRVTIFRQTWKYRKRDD